MTFNSNEMDAMTAVVKTFSNEDALTDTFTQTICEQLQQAIRERGRAYLVVSGGRTPVPLFNQLSQQDLPWSQVTVLLADERWLPADHEASNTRLVRQHLLQKKAADAEFLHFANDAETIDAAVAAFNQQAAELPTFDVVVLGLGEDGHTASIFPCSQQLNDALTTEAACLAVTPTTAPYDRISLSKSRLMNSRTIYFHLVGTSKAEVLNQAMQPGASFPASVFLQQDTVPVKVMLALPPAPAKE